MNGVVLGFLLGFLVGCVTGALYFAALWSAVRRIPGSNQQAWRLMAGLPIRLALLFAVLYLAVNHLGAPGLLGVLTGFLSLRWRAMARIRATPGRSVELG